MAERPTPRPEPPDPLIGRVLAGAYRLDSLLGRGAMGAVYRAQHSLLAQPFAVKVLHPELADDEDVRRRFLQEAEALTRFTHKNAVPVRHCGEEQGLVFLAMDLCRGETLEALLAREGALPETRAVRLTAQVLAALEEAHRGGIVHRDLKPANVMVEPGRPGEPEVARVLDFGLSRILTEGRDGAAASRVSALGEVVGTVAYMSPEQALGEDLDGRSDLFSLGVMLYEMVEGRHPFTGGTMASIITRLLEVERLLAEPAVPLRASEGLQRVLGHALQKDRDLRFRDAASFAAALSDLEAGRRVAPAPDPLGEARRRARRRRWALGLAAALALLGGGAWLAATLAQRPPGALSSEEREAAARALAQGRWSAAVRAYEAIVAAPGATGEDALALAEARIGVGDVEAERDLAAARRLLPGDGRVDVALGRFFHQVRRDPARAREAYAEALSRDRRSSAARLARIDLMLDPALAPFFEEHRQDPLGFAASDLAALEAAGDTSPPVAVARSRLRLAESDRPGADRAALLREAHAAAEAAVVAEPLWEAGWEQRTHVLVHEAGMARQARRHDEALELARQAVADVVQALACVRAEPARRRQGAAEVRLLRTSITTRVHAWDWDGLAEDARALGRLVPGEVDTLREQALALRTAGRFEEALAVYETLKEIAPDGSGLSDLAFCHQRVGLGQLVDGDRAGGLATLTRAATAYDEAVRLAPRAPVILAYRGETSLLLARWDPAHRGGRLELARADLDAAARLSSGAEEDREVLFRRAALRLEQGELEGARDDIAKIVQGQSALNAAFHGRYARCLLALAARASLAGDAPTARARRDEALVQARLAADLSGDEKAPALLLEVQVLLLSAPQPLPDSEAAAAAQALARAVAPGLATSEAVAGEVSLWRALLDALTSAKPSVSEAAVAALHLRRDEAARGREGSSPAFYDALATLADALGRADAAAWARTLSQRVPP